MKAPAQATSSGGGMAPPAPPPHGLPARARPPRIHVPVARRRRRRPRLACWSFPFDALESLRPKMCVQTRTFAGLDQIHPWLFYHKVVGVGHFLLFVKEKAAKHVGWIHLLGTNFIEYEGSGERGPVVGLNDIHPIAGA